MSQSAKNGRNQHRDNPIIDDHPDLPGILQNYIDSNVKQKAIPNMLEKDHGISIKLRSVQSIMKKFDVKTTRKSGLDVVDKGVAILKVAQDDPLNRWGARLLKEKLAREGIHIPRDEISVFRRVENPEATASRHPQTRKPHKHGLWSTGPNEEWCVDGHEKLAAMGIAIWGIVDKFARLELGLWAVPNARLIDVPPILMLRLIRELGGMALTTTMDKGSELGKLISMLTTLRKENQPYLDEATLPTCNAVKSIFNITRERGWRPLWEKELGNVSHEYHSGKFCSGFQPNNLTHESVSYWLWGRIVQLRIDGFRLENHNHFVRKQPKSLLPTGGRRIDFYSNPEEYKGTNQLIPIPHKTVDALLAEYDRPDLLQFGSDDVVAICEASYRAIGSPELNARVGWSVFQNMVEHIGTL